MTQRGALRLQRLAGNRAVSSLLSAAPAIKVRDFEAVDETGGTASASAAVARRATPDKSTEETAGEQDQGTSVNTFQGTAQGVKITIDGTGCFTSSDFPDGFRWTQVIDTNDPLHGASSPYVDPHPNDDTKPFYWTDAEEAASPCQFRDAPSRNPPSSDVTFWQATLGLNGVNESTKTVQGFAYLTYGFTIDASGTVTVRPPVAADGTNHRLQLAAEFPDWTFA